jgi:hypothetical protein
MPSLRSFNSFRVILILMLVEPLSERPVVDAVDNVGRYALSRVDPDMGGIDNEYMQD